MSEDLAHKILNSIDQEKFQENKDHFMKLMEDDPKLIAWIAWGMGYLFVDYTHEQMYELIGTATEADLKKRIAFVDYDITTVGTKSHVIFDRHYALNKNGAVFRYLDIENQLNPYPYEEVQARAYVYLCANLYWQMTHGLSNYADVVPPVSLWIFPSSPEYRQNTIIQVVISFPSEAEEYKPVSSGELQKMEKVSTEFAFKMVIVLCYLGDPTEITDDMLVKDSTAKEAKQNYLLLLLDTFYSFKVGKQKRLEIAERVFNLKGPKTEQEVDTMEGLQDTVLDDVYTAGKNEGITLGSKKTEEKNTNAFANYLVANSGGNLTKEQALKEVESILSEY